MNTSIAKTTTRNAGKLAAIGTPKWLDATFGFNVAAPVGPAKKNLTNYKKIVKVYKTLAADLIRFVPKGPQLTTALTNLQRSIKYAKLGIQAEGVTFS